VQTVIPLYDAKGFLFSPGKGLNDFSVPEEGTDRDGSLLFQIQTGKARTSGTRCSFPSNSTPTPHQCSAMVALGRKPSWQVQLRRTKAKECLFAGRLDKFPLVSLQDIATRFLRDKSPLLSSRGIPPQSLECDILFANELAAVKGELGTHESAILSCLHLLSYDQARGQIVSIKPNTSLNDLFLERRLDVYLQCIALSRRARPNICSEDEALAATELLGVLKGRSTDFPSILGLLRAVGTEKCEQLLPVALIKKILDISHYEANLTRELDALRKCRRWFDAYKLVCGLRDIIGLPKADRMLRDIFPDYPMWAAWRPDFRRILSWESPILTPYRDRLGPLLDLEGPDVTGQQRGTLRMSSLGSFQMLSDPTCPHGGHNLHHFLESLDDCLAVGPNTLDLLTALCIEPATLSRDSLDRLDAIVQLKDDAVSKTLAAFVRSLAPDTDLTTRINVLVLALPVLTLYPQLQYSFGISLGLPRHASDALFSGQHYFRHCLISGNAADSVGLAVVSLGRVLYAAKWLHTEWQPTYISMLHEFSTDEASVSLLSIVLHDSTHLTVAGPVAFLETCLGTARIVYRNPDIAELPGSDLSTHSVTWSPDSTRV